VAYFDERGPGREGTLYVDLDPSWPKPLPGEIALLTDLAQLAEREKLPMPEIERDLWENIDGGRLHTESTLWSITQMVGASPTFRQQVGDRLQKSIAAKNTTALRAPRGGHGGAWRG
jgi:hypothetical protein